MEEGVSENCDRAKTCSFRASKLQSFKPGKLRLRLHPAHTKVEAEEAMQDFRNLKVWRKSHELTLGIYEATRKFPHDERFGLVSQMREAAISVESNLAEGSSRSSDADFRRFLFNSLGSLSELECQLLISRDLALLRADAHQGLQVRIVEIRRMMWPLVECLSRKPARSR